MVPLLILLIASIVANILIGVYLITVVLMYRYKLRNLTKKNDVQ